MSETFNRLYDNETISLDDVRKTVVEISQIKDDPEAAHSYEDMLYENILNTIQQYCREALISKELKFPRWCA